MYALILSSLFASAPAADALPKEAHAALQKELLFPLEDAEEKRHRFSRALIRPSVLTVRATDPIARKDKAGAEFFTFSVLEGRTMDALKETYTGCVYTGSGAVFVKRGDVHYPAAFLIGKTKEKAAAHVCVSG